jgi:hypothetical protein
MLVPSIAKTHRPTISLNLYVTAHLPLFYSLQLLLFTFILIVHSYEYHKSKKSPCSRKRIDGHVFHHDSHVKNIRDGLQHHESVLAVEACFLPQILITNERKEGGDPIDWELQIEYD